MSGTASEAELPETLRPYAPGAPLRFGTSSFSSKDWVGPFYPVGLAPGGFLSWYARTFDTVEIDATYYAIPSPRLVDGWADKTPADFRISCKLPRSIVHGGKGARPDPGQVLQPDEVYADRDAFLEVIGRLGPKLDTILVQFPYFNRQAFPSAGPFLERLDGFLADLPKERFRYAVEVRNKAWLTERYHALLDKHGIVPTLVDQAWMPHGDRVASRFDLGRRVYVRLLGDRQEIEKLTTTWEREVIDREASLARWADLLAKFVAEGRRVLVYVNNHYAGHAPATVRRLRAYVAERLGQGA